MKRGQMEVVGLLVIVILLLVIGLIVLRFSLRPASTTLTDTRSSLESTRLLQALVLTTIQGISFQEHAAACSTSSTACSRLGQELEDIFSVILKQGQQSSFYLLSEDQNIFSFDNCPLGVFSSYPFTHQGVFYEVKLRLCTAQL